MYMISKNICMKYIVVLILFFLIFQQIFVVKHRAEEVDNNQVTITLSIKSYEINTINGQDELFVKDFGRCSTPGMPSLPSRIYAIAIPPYAEFIDLSYELGKEIIHPEPCYISPVSSPGIVTDEDILISEEDQQVYQQNYQLIYESDNPFPTNVVEFVRTAKYRKYNLVDVKVTPFSYRPLSGQLVYYPEVKITINYKLPKNHITNIVDDLKRTESIAQDLIINYDQAQTWYLPTNPMNRGLYDFVIITTEYLTDFIQSLVNWEIAKGRTVNVVTTEWISNNYQGVDFAEKIRNFLREKYPSNVWGIEDVCLIGDYSDIPIRQTWQIADSKKPATDYYYAELSYPDNESWDADGDGKYGEDEDPVDFYPEIHVGRIPSSNHYFVSKICDKIPAYEQNTNISFKKNILLLGAFSDEETDNAVLMEEIAAISHLYNWNKTRMYEKNPDYWSTYDCDYPLYQNNVVNVWSGGTFGFVNWAGHGSAIQVYMLGCYGPPPFLESTDCLALNDDFPAIIFAGSCYNSDSNHADNLGKSMMKNGAVAFLGANKPTYYDKSWSELSHGNMQTLEWLFTNYVTSGNYSIGGAFQQTIKQMYLHHYWTHEKYELFNWGNIYGNPNLWMLKSYANRPPDNPDKPLGSTLGRPEILYNFSTITIDPDGQQVCYGWDWDGDLVVDEWTESIESNSTVTLEHNWSEAGDYSIKVKANDSWGNESNWSEPLNIHINPYVEIDSIQDGLSILVTIKNDDNSTMAVDIPWSLKFDGGLFLLPKDKQKSGILDIPAGSSVDIGLCVFGFGGFLNPMELNITCDEISVKKDVVIFGPFIRFK